VGKVLVDCVVERWEGGPFAPYAGACYALVRQFGPPEREGDPTGPVELWCGPLPFVALNAMLGWPSELTAIACRNKGLFEIASGGAKLTPIGRRFIELCIRLEWHRCLLDVACAVGFVAPGVFRFAFDRPASSHEVDFAPDGFDPVAAYCAMTAGLV